MTDQDLINEQIEKTYKKECRKLALENSPCYKIDGTGSEVILPAIEKISEAEIVYQWLIKI